MTLIFPQGLWTRPLKDATIVDQTDAGLLLASSSYNMVIKNTLERFPPSYSIAIANRYFPRVLTRKLAQLQGEIFTAGQWFTLAQKLS